MLTKKKNSNLIDILGKWIELLNFEKCFKYTEK